MTRNKLMVGIALMVFIITSLSPVTGWASEPMPVPTGEPTPVVDATAAPTPTDDASAVPEQSYAPESPLSPVEHAPSPDAPIEFTGTDAQQAQQALNAIRAYVNDRETYVPLNDLQKKLDEFNSHLPASGNVRLAMEVMGQLRVGDFNNSNTVDSQDVSGLLQRMTMSPPAGGAALKDYLRADFNKDGRVDSADIPGFLKLMSGLPQYEVTEVKFRSETKISEITWGPMGKVTFHQVVNETPYCVPNVQCNKTYYEARLIPRTDGAVRETIKSWSNYNGIYFYPMGPLQDDNPETKEGMITFETGSDGPDTTAYPRYVLQNRIDNKFSITKWYNYKPTSFVVTELQVSVVPGSSPGVFNTTQNYWGMKTVEYDLIGTVLSETIRRQDSKRSYVEIKTVYGAVPYKRLEVGVATGPNVEDMTVHVIENPANFSVVYDATKAFPFVTSLHAERSTETFQLDVTYDAVAKKFNHVITVPPPPPPPIPGGSTKLKYYDESYVLPGGTVRFNEGVTQTRAREIIAAVGATSTSANYDFNLYNITIPAGENNEWLLNRFITYPEVDYIVPNVNSAKFPPPQLRGQLSIDLKPGVSINTAINALKALGAFPFSAFLRSATVRIQPGITPSAQTAMINAILATGLFSSVYAS